MAKQKEKIKAALHLQPTAGQLIEYLQGFEKDAKVRIWHDYKTYQCQVACNFDHQWEINTVLLLLGFVDNPNA